MMGGFRSGKWADVMTRKVNTGLCKTLSVKRLKTMGVFDAENNQDQFFIHWVNEFGEDAGKVTITRQAGGNGNKRSLRVEIGGSVDASGAFVTVTGQVIQITTTACYYGGVPWGGWLQNHPCFVWAGTPTILPMGCRG